MRTLGLFLALLASLLLAPGAQAQQRFELSGLGGDSLSDRDLASGSHVLVVWASWSPRSRDIVDRVAELRRAVGSRARVATVVFQEDAGTVREYLRTAGNLAAPVYLDTDGTFSKKHGVTTLPGLLIFRDGQVQFQGQLPPNPGPVLDKALGR